MGKWTTFLQPLDNQAAGIQPKSEQQSTEHACARSKDRNQFCPSTQETEVHHETMQAKDPGNEERNAEQDLEQSSTKRSANTGLRIDKPSSKYHLRQHPSLSEPTDSDLSQDSDAASNVLTTATYLKTPTFDSQWLSKAVEALQVGKIPDLEGRHLEDNGEVLDDDGVPIGRLALGRHKLKALLVAKAVCDARGGMWAKGKKVPGVRVDLLSWDPSTPSPEAERRQPTAKAIPEYKLPSLYGRCIEDDGHILGDDGEVLGKLVEGLDKLKLLVKNKAICDDSGGVWAKGRLVPRARVDVVHAATFVSGYSNSWPDLWRDLSDSDGDEVSRRLSGVHDLDKSKASMKRRSVSLTRAVNDDAALSSPLKVPQQTPTHLASVTPTPRRERTRAVPKRSVPYAPSHSLEYESIKGSKDRGPHSRYIPSNDVSALDSLVSDPTSQPRTAVQKASSTKGKDESRQKAKRRPGVLELVFSPPKKTSASTGGRKKPYTLFLTST